MKVHLVDGTYELFRYHFSPANKEPRLGAQRGVLNTVLDLVADGATHIGIATDHVIESWRNDLYDGYKDGSDIDPDIFAQFPEVEELLDLAGFEVWPQVTHEADDAMAAGAAMAVADDRVEQVIICTPDKDLAQCVTSDGRVVQLDRRREITYDRAGVIEKFGVPPESIPDYLGVVGDTADGFPGLQGWGAKSAAVVLTRYGHIDQIPFDVAEWDVDVRGAGKLALTLRENFEDALLFRRIATVDIDAPVSATVDEMAWLGPQPGFDERCIAIGAERQAARLHKLWAEKMAADGHAR
jgi:5'-3' exonuclease